MVITLKCHLETSALSGPPNLGAPKQRDLSTEILTLYERRLPKSFLTLFRTLITCYRWARPHTFKVLCTLMTRMCVYQLNLGTL